MFITVFDLYIAPIFGDSPFQNIGPESHFPDLSAELKILKIK